MNLTDAQKVAEGVALLFQPFCERVEIAGSIRRLRPEPKDVDLVVIPKFREHRDLLGNVERRENLLRTSLVEYVASNVKWVQWTPIVRAGLERRGCTPAEDAKFFSISGRHAQIDFFMATPETFATVLLTRTGSKEHNIWISQRAQARRGAFKASEGIWLPERGMIHPKSEEEFYELLGLPFIAPEKRERRELAHLEIDHASQREAGYQEGKCR